MDRIIKRKKPLLVRRMEVGMLVVFVGDGTEGPAGVNLCLFFQMIKDIQLLYKSTIKVKTLTVKFFLNFF